MSHDLFRPALDVDGHIQAKRSIGSTTIGRDALEDLLYMARRETQPVDGMIFWSFSRLARDQLDSQFIEADLRQQTVGRLGPIGAYSGDIVPSTLLPK